jgi:hypothetical protein
MRCNAVEAGWLAGCGWLLAGCWLVGPLALARSSPYAGCLGFGAYRPHCVLLPPRWFGASHSPHCSGGLHTPTIYGGRGFSFSVSTGGVQGLLTAPRTPIATGRLIADQKQRTAAALRPALKRAGSRALERPICSTWRHTKFPNRSRLAHTAASRPLPGAGQRREASGWFLAKDLRS